MTDDIYYLSMPLHKNSIKIEMTEDIESNLIMSIDGSVIAVKKSTVGQYVNDKDLAMVRMGFHKPSKELVSYSDEDGFYKFLSCIVDLD